jgi:hypothetical protein
MVRSVREKKQQNRREGGMMVNKHDCGLVGKGEEARNVMVR